MVVGLRPPLPSSLTVSCLLNGILPVCPMEPPSLMIHSTVTYFAAPSAGAQLFMSQLVISSWRRRALWYWRRFVQGFRCMRSSCLANFSAMKFSNSKRFNGYVLKRKGNRNACQSIVNSGKESSNERDNPQMSGV